MDSKKANAKKTRGWGGEISPALTSRLGSFVSRVTRHASWVSFANMLTLIVLFAGITFFAHSPNTRLDRYMSLTYAVIMALGVQITLRSLPAGAFIVWASYIMWIHSMTPILTALTTVLYAGGVLFLLLVPVPVNRIYNAVCCYAVANVIWQALILTDHTIIYRPINALVGLQTHMGETSALLAICLPAFFRRRWVWLVPIPVAGILAVPQSVGALASFAVGCLAIVMFVKKNAVRVPVICAIIAIVMIFVTCIDRFNPTGIKNTRLQTWGEAIFIALEKPVRGWGFGQFCAVVPLLSTPTQLPVDDRKRLYDEVEDKKGFLRTAYKITGSTTAEGVAAYYSAKKYPTGFYFEAHNEYIEALFAAGITGLCLLISALAHILWKGWEQRDRLPFLGLTASCAGATIWFIWQIVPIAVITVVWAALCLRERPEA